MDTDITTDSKVKDTDTVIRDTMVRDITHNRDMDNLVSKDSLIKLDSMVSKDMASSKVDMEASRVLT